MGVVSDNRVNVAGIESCWRTITRDAPRDTETEYTR